jgi:hypothetical protein
MATTESAGPFVGGGCRPPDSEGDLISIDGCAITPTSWSLDELGSPGREGTGYGSGGVSASGPDFVLTGLGPSFTPEYYAYTGYLRLEVTCSDGSKQTLDSWTTIDGGPTRSFNHTYSNPCCNGKDSDNTTTVLSGVPLFGILPPNGIDQATFITRILQAAKKQSSAYYIELIKGFKNAGAVITDEGVCRSIPKGKFFSSGVPAGQTPNAGQQAVLDSLKRKIAELGGKIIKSKPKPRGGGSLTLPMIMPLPLMPGWNPATGRFDDGWTGACNDPGTLNPGVGTAILASTNGRNSINLANIYGSSMSPSLTSNNHVINAFGGSPPTSFPVLLVPKG